MTLTCTVSTSAPVTVTSPAASATFRVRGFPESTLRVLLSSSTEGIFRLSNGLLVWKPPLAVKKITAPMPANTNTSAAINKAIMMSLFMFVLLVYKVPHACYHAYGRMFPLHLTGDGGKSFKVGSCHCEKDAFPDETISNSPGACFG